MPAVMSEWNHEQIKVLHYCKYCRYCREMVILYGHYVNMNVYHFFFCHIPIHLSFSPPALVFFLEAPPRVDRHLGSIIIINLSCDQMALRFESICCSQSLLRRHYPLTILYCASCRSFRLNERPRNKKKKTVSFAVKERV